MNDYNASDLRQIRTAKRRERARDAERKLVVLGLMSSSAGRAYVHDRLTRCHIFETSFSDSAQRMAFAEGERNVGLQDLIDVQQFCPDQYVQMLREANDRKIVDGRSSSGPSPDPAPDDDGRERDPANPGWDVGGRVDSEYDPDPASA